MIIESVNGVKSRQIYAKSKLHTDFNYLLPFGGVKIGKFAPSSFVRIEPSEVHTYDRGSYFTGTDRSEG